MTKPKTWRDKAQEWRLAAQLSADLIFADMLLTLAKEADDEAAISEMGLQESAP